MCIDRRGKPRHYFRVKGKHYPLCGEPGSYAFLNSYHALLALHYAGKLDTKPHPRRSRFAPSPIRPMHDILVPGSVGWVIVEYLKSRRFADLAVTTRQTYRSELDFMRRSIGGRILVRLNTEDIDLYSAKIERERGPACADLQLRLISALWKFSKGLPECRRNGRSNPTYDAEKHYKVKTPHEPWPIPVQRSFLNAASSSLRLAFYLLLFTGQRRSDVVNMNWSDFDGERINITQAKTCKSLSIHAHKTLRDALQATPRTHQRILTTKWGRPYTRNGLSKAVKSTLRTIGASKYTVHGLRKSAAVALAEIGCSEFEIMAVLGHKTSKMAVHYCREANKSRLNETAIKAWEKMYIL